MKDFLEALMLICFGFSWPVSLVKSFKARTAKSTSLLFLMLILIGYAVGIAAKFVEKNISYVLVVYFFNFFVVFLNLIVYFRNRKIDKAR